MGLLTDFVIAKDSDVDLLLSSEDLSKNWQIMQSSGLDPVKIGTLYAILKNEEYDLKNHDILQKLDENDEGPWLFKITDDFTTKVANVSSLGIDKVAIKWSETEELKMDDWDVESTSEFLKELEAFSKDAVKVSSKLFLWICL